MGNGSALRTSLTFHHGLVWFTSMEGDRLSMSIDHVPLTLRYADDAIHSFAAKRPLRILLGPFVYEETVVATLSLQLRALDNRLTEIPISEFWIKVMIPVFERALLLSAVREKTSFSLMADLDGEVVECPTDLHTLPPHAMGA